MSESSILDQIQGPQDLNSLSSRELRRLAEEIRAEIIEVIPRIGGHFGPNLGAVELAVALHTVFDSPRDKIIWDVGHQAYPHKILTGRRGRMPTIRQKGGLAPFCSREESEHDIFGAGHGGTSISAALGLAIARDLRGGQEHIVAVIGDGSLTAGMAFEALDHAGDLKTRLIVVVNDNGMSISPSVGALANYLTQLRVDPHYRRFKENLEKLLQLTPLGELMIDTADRFLSSMKQFVMQDVFFENLGFTYLGPVDGHDLEALLATLRFAATVKGPVVVHALTEKGKGYRPAEEHPEKLHAIKPPVPSAAQDLPTYTDVFGRAIVELARENEDIVAITAAMSDGTGLNDFAMEFPNRFFDVGIAEQHAVTFAAGLAVGGKRPVAAIYSTFLQRAFDQIAHDVCLQNLPVVLCLDRAGLVGNDGPTHQGLYDLAYLRCLPNMTIMAPQNGLELRWMLKTALEGVPGPVAIRYPRDRVPEEVPEDAQWQILPVGRGELLREGRDVGLLALGALVTTALRAAERLAQEGISVAVANARFVKPLDHELLAQLARECGALVTLEDHGRVGGFGAAVLEGLSDLGLTGVPVLRLGVPDCLIYHASRAEQLVECGLDVEGVTTQIRAFLRTEGQKPLWEPEQPAPAGPHLRVVGQ